MIAIGKLSLKDHMTDDQKLQYLQEKIDIIQGIMKANGDVLCDIQTIRLTKAKSVFGSCIYKGKMRVALEFSRLNFVAGNDEYLNTTIAHELVHAIVGMPSGHGKKWQSKAAEYSKLLQTSIKTKSRPSAARIEGDISGAWTVGESTTKPKYRLTCPCGAVNSLRYRASHMTNYPVYYKCKHCKEGIIVEKLR